MALPTRVSRQQLDPFDSAQREFEHMLGRVFGATSSEAGGRLAPYGVDVREDADRIYVEAELPGYRKEDVNVTLENQTLTISAQRKTEQQQGNGNKGEWLLRERSYTQFHRSFTLPPTVDEQTVNAKLNDGILTITLTKREETKPRRISVA